MNSQIRIKLDDFFAQYKQQKYKKGDILIRADEPNGIFYLKNGAVKQYVINQKGNEIVVNIFKPISFFPMPWAINNTKNIYFYEAIDSVETYKAPRSDVIEFLKKNPDILYNLISRIYIGIEGLLQRMIYLMSGDAYPRLITELLILAKRFGTKDPKSKSISMKLFENDIAAESGMTRETVSRIIKILKDKKLLTLKNNILEIQDITRLEEELGAY